MAESSELRLGEDIELLLSDVEESEEEEEEEEEDEDPLELVDEDPELELDVVLARCKEFRPSGWMCLVKPKSGCELEFDSVELSSSLERPEEEVESVLRLETSLAWLSAPRALSIDLVEESEDVEAGSVLMLDASLNAS